MLVLKTIPRITLLVCLIVTLSSNSLSVKRALYGAEGEPKLEISVTPKEIYEGESAKLTISVTNAKLDTPPSLEQLRDDFSIESLEPTKRSSVRIINSVRTENYATDYNYRLTPKRVGVITIPPPTIEVEGKRLQAEPVELAVREKTKTDLVLLEVETSANKPIYPLVPFEVSVNVYVKEYPPKYKEYDPLLLIVHNLDAPLLSIPWLESRDFDDNLASEPLDDWLKKLSARDYGFALNNYRRSNGVFDFDFSFFDEPIRKSFFLPKPEKVTRSDASGKNASFWKYSFTRKMRATSPSTFSFAPATLKGDFLDFSDADEPKSRPIFLSSPPLSVQIKEIPIENAPDNYVGIYGDIKQEASLSTNEASVGDAITLTLAYAGYGSFTAASAPNISELDGIKGVFRVYPASERSIDSGVAFDYKLRPLKEGTFEFPAIKASFFNVESGRFETMESATSQFIVKAGVLAASDDLNETTIKVPTGVAKNRNSENVLKRQKERFKLIAIIVVGAFASFAVLASVFFAGRKALQIHTERVASSNRRILASARKTLDMGLFKLDATPSEGFSLIRLAFLQLVGKRLPHALDSYTDAEIIDFLNVEFAKETRKESGPNNTLARLKDFFEQSEKIRFGGCSSLDSNYKENVVALFDSWSTVLLARTKKLSTIARDPKEAS